MDGYSFDPWGPPPVSETGANATAGVGRSGADSAEQQQQRLQQPLLHPLQQPPRQPLQQQEEDFDSWGLPFRQHSAGADDDDDDDDDLLSNNAGNPSAGRVTSRFGGSFLGQSGDSFGDDLLAEIESTRWLWGDSAGSPAGSNDSSSEINAAAAAAAAVEPRLLAPRIVPANSGRTPGRAGAPPPQPFPRPLDSPDSGVFAGNGTDVYGMGRQPRLLPPQLRFDLQPPHGDGRGLSAGMTPGGLSSSSAVRPSDGAAMFGSGLGRSPFSPVPAPHVIDDNGSSKVAGRFGSNARLASTFDARGDFGRYPTSAHTGGHGRLRADVPAHDLARPVGPSSSGAPTLFPVASPEPPSLSSMINPAASINPVPSIATRTISNGLPCKFFSQGSCKKGPYCEFVHLDPRLAAALGGSAAMFQQSTSKSIVTAESVAPAPVSVATPAVPPHPTLDMSQLGNSDATKDKLKPKKARGGRGGRRKRDSTGGSTAGSESAYDESAAGVDIVESEERQTKSDDGWSVVQRGIRGDIVSPPDGVGYTVDAAPLGILTADWDENDRTSPDDSVTRSQSTGVNNKKQRKADSLREREEQQRLRENKRLAREEEEEQEELRRQALQAEQERERQRLASEALRAEMAAAASREKEIKQRKKQERERRRAEAAVARQKNLEQKALEDKQRKEHLRLQRAEERKQELEQQAMQSEIAAELEARAHAAEIADTTVMTEQQPPLVDSSAHQEIAQEQVVAENCSPRLPPMLGSETSAQDSSKSLSTTKAQAATAKLHGTSAKSHGTVSKPQGAVADPPSWPLVGSDKSVLDVLDAAIESGPRGEHQRRRTRRSAQTVAASLAGERMTVLLNTLSSSEMAAWLDGDYTTGAGKKSFIYAPGIGLNTPTATAADTPTLLRQLDQLLIDDAAATSTAIGLSAAKAGAAAIPDLVTDEDDSRVVSTISVRSPQTEVECDEDAAQWIRYWSLCESELENESERHSSWYVRFRQWLWSDEARCSAEQRQEINRVKHSRSHYEVLAVARDASTDECEAAFRRVAVRLQEPAAAFNGGGGTPPTTGALAAYKASVNAFRVLSTSSTRASYDSELKRGKGVIDTGVSAFNSDGSALLQLLRYSVLVFGVFVLVFVQGLRFLTFLWIGLQMIFPPLRWAVDAFIRSAEEGRLADMVDRFDDWREKRANTNLPSNVPSAPAPSIKSSEVMDWCGRCNAYHHSISAPGGATVSCPLELSTRTTISQSADSSSQVSGVITISAAAVAPESPAGIQAAAAAEPMISVELDGGALFVHRGRVVYVPTKPHVNIGVEHQDVTDLLQADTVRTLVPYLPSLHDPVHGAAARAQRTLAGGDAQTASSLSASDLGVLRGARHARAADIEEGRAHVVPTKQLSKKKRLRRK